MRWISSFTFMENIFLFWPINVEISHKTTTSLVLVLHFCTWLVLGKHEIHLIEVGSKLKTMLGRNYRKGQ